MAEIIVCTGIAGIIMLGVAQSLFVASRIADDTENRSNDSYDNANALDAMVRDLSMATSILSRTSKSISFIVPDRTGDNVAETLTYTWSGTPGDNLTRAQNSESPVTYVNKVQGFVLEYSDDSISVTKSVRVPGGYEERMFHSFESWSGVTGTLSSFETSSGDWVCQFFTIPDSAIPADSNSLEITKVAIKASVPLSALGATFSVGIHRSVGGGNPEPQNNALGTAATLSSGLVPLWPTWIDATLSNVVINNPSSNKDLCLVIKGSGSRAINVNYLYSSSAPDNGTQMIWTNNGGGNWDPRKNRRDNNDLLFRMYTRGALNDTWEDVTTTGYALRSVRISLRAGDSNSPTYRTMVRTVNKPSVP